MTMTRSLRARALSIAVTLAVTTFCACALAQIPSNAKDDDLEGLLKKVEQGDKKPDPPKADSIKPKAKPSAPVSPSDKPKTSGEVSGKDKELDDLLGKIGATKDEPSPDEKKPPMPGGEGDDKAKTSPDPSGGSKKPKDLTGEAKALDEHLKELAGKREKKAQKGAQGKQRDQGPLGDLVKQMREVEERLGKPDTGEQTREKQAEIVKKMDTMIEQMKQAKSQQQAMRQLRKGQKPGQGKPGDGQDNLADGPPSTRPEKPKGQSIVALDKDAWGHLPPELRSEMENVFKEDLLPARADLIKRYYIAVSRKSLAREE